MLSQLWRSRCPRTACRPVVGPHLFARFRKDTHGSVMVYVAVMMPVLLGVTGMALDGSLWLANKRSLQSTADIAALSAAFEMTRIGDATLAKSAALADAALNGYHPAAGDIMVINRPPKSGLMAGSNAAFEVIITRPAQTFLSSIVYSEPISVAARAVATIAGNGGGAPCILALDETSNDALKVNNGAVYADSCAMQINSNNPAALNVFKNGVVEADEINVVGNYVEDGYISSIPNFGQPTVADPFQGLSTPGFSGCDHTDLAFNDGNHLLSPGVYCGGVQISGSARVELQAGTYVIDNGTLQMSGNNTSLEGTGVTIYAAGDSEVRIQGGGAVNLSAPMSGTYAGMLMYGDPNASTGTKHHINGDNDMLYEGYMYFPKGELTVNGNGSATTTVDYSGVIARKLNFGGNGEIHFDYDANNPNVPALAGGSTVTLVE